MKVCCGEERSTRFCPDCGKRLAPELEGLLAHCHQYAKKCRTQAQDCRTCPGKDNPDVIKTAKGFTAHAEKWERYAELLSDLLEACKTALKAVDEAYEATGFFRVANTSHERMAIEAAIAKATGGQP